MDETKRELLVDTKFHIMHSITKPLKDLTVKQICEDAGISRQTFYRCFSTKEDIPYWYSQHIEKLALNEIGRTLTWEEGHKRHCEYLCRERDSLSIMLKETLPLPFFGGHPSSANRRNTMLRTLREWRDIEPNDDLLFCITAFSHMELVVFQEWCRQGLYEDPALYGRRMCSLVPPLLYNAMQLPRG